MSTIASIPFVGWVIPFLIVLGVVVAIHEYGHYIVGRWCGIKAEVFSIGFGKPLFSWIDKRGTRWQIAPIPLGGYVKFVGDMNAASAGANKEALEAMSEAERSGAFHLAALWKRTLTILAGPGFNFILSIFVFALLAMLAGREVNEPVIGEIRADAHPEIGFQAGDRVISVNGVFVQDFSSLRAELVNVDGQRVKALVDRGAGEQEIDIFFVRRARIDLVLPGSPAADAGVEQGDVITAVNGEATPRFEDLVAAILATSGEPLDFTIERGAETLDLTVTPRMEDVPNADGVVEKRPRIGVSNDSFGGVEPQVESAGVFEALRYGVARTEMIITGTLSYIYEMFAGRADSSQLGGPIQIAKVSGQAAEQGLESFLTMIALISTSIGLINLFPIPVLDGGHLVFYAYEALRGKPLRERWQEYGNGLGLGLILLLMVFATYNDVLRLF